MNLEGDGFRTYPCVDDEELLDDVVDLPLDSLVAGLDVPNHLEQLVAIVEVVEEGDSVTGIGQ